MLRIRLLRGWVLRREWMNLFHSRTMTDKIRICLVGLILFWSLLLSAVVIKVKVDVIGRRRIDGHDDQRTRAHGDDDETNDVCRRSVHIYGTINEMEHWPELTEWHAMMVREPQLDNRVTLGCELSNGTCSIDISIGTDVDMLRGRDVVIFGLVPDAFKVKGRLDAVIGLDPEVNQTWFFYAMESPHRTILWNQNLDIAKLKYHQLMSYRRDSSVHLAYGVYHHDHGETMTNSTTSRGLAVRSPTKSKLVAWVSSNCEEVAWPRKPFLSRLRARLPLHEYGACGTKRCLPRDSAECATLIRQYKFLLVLGSAECTDLIPRDFWSLALANDVVPVVYGVPKPDVDRVAPSHSYIHVSDFVSPDALASYLIELAHDEGEYKRFFEWKKTGEIELKSPFKPQIVCEIFRSNSNSDAQPPPLMRTVGESNWYKGCRKMPGRMALDKFSPDQQYRDYNHWTIWRP